MQRLFVVKGFCKKVSAIEAAWETGRLDLNALHEVELDDAYRKLKARFVERRAIAAEERLQIAAPVSKISHDPGR